ncbi:MAG: D-alanyl-D-alanine carboxypeptidase family protein [Hydrotalea sp.]|nr:D-alanyl-D-alanine carboxypeptidase family protein [Hydrotalea sp.]
MLPAILRFLPINRRETRLKKISRKTIGYATAIGLSLLIGLTTFQASAGSIYRTSSSIVVDAETNKILYDNGGDELAYPASLTKTMTLLLLFDQLKSGRWTTSTLLNVSATAAKRPKTRLGVRAGDQISVDLAIRSIVVLSANDAAVAVGENIAGSESNFARLMNAKAKEVGMTKTHFNNASGLPSPGQVTTAQDMATLGLYILANYPEYYHYFSIDSFRFKNRTILTHNRVLEQFSGADGFKTGFINRSGYNLLTSAERNGKRVVAVVLGGSTARERDSAMTFLLDRYIPYAASYSRSFNLDQLKQANRTPQESLKQAYIKYIKPAETAQEKAARLRQERMAAAAKKRLELHANLLAAGKPNSNNASALSAANNSSLNKQTKNVAKVASTKKTKIKKSKKKTNKQASNRAISQQAVIKNSGGGFIEAAYAETLPKKNPKKRQKKDVQ